MIIFYLSYYNNSFFLAYFYYFPCKYQSYLVCFGPLGERELKTIMINQHENSNSSSNVTLLQVTFLALLLSNTASAQNAAVLSHQNVFGIGNAIGWLISGSFIGLFTAMIRTNHGFFKRTFDILTSIVGLVLLSPLFPVIALLIKMDSKGPVFYKQERLGKSGRPFHIMKFRTMSQDAEKESGPVWARKRDPRVTALGNFLRAYHLDEIPQLFNVLDGDMSLIGPRPERPQLAEVIEKEVPGFGKRLEVKPGVTGLAQIRYQYGASIKDARRKLKYDLIYRERKCWTLDLIILLRTIEKILIGEKSR